MPNRDKTLDTFPKLLRLHAAERADHPAIREKRRGIWQTLTWAEFAHEVQFLASALKASGFKRGGHVALIGDNRPRLYMAMCATQVLGGVPVPLYQDAVALELVHPINSAEVSHVFAEDQEQVDKALDILGQCPTLKHIVYDNDRGMRHYEQAQVKSYEQFIELGKQHAHALDFDQEIERGKGSDASAMFFTSGTTGQPKGVVLSHASLIDRARTAAEMEGLTPADVAVAYLPPAWIGQNMFSYAQPLVVGYCICCPESSETMLADMREIGPTYFFAPPRVLEAMLTEVSIRMEDAGGWMRSMYAWSMAVAREVGPKVLAREPVSSADSLRHTLASLLICKPLRDVLGMSRLRVAYTAGEAIGGDLLMFFRSIGINLKQLYGSTETAVFVCIQPNNEVKPDTVGVAVDGVELRFTAQRELLIRSPGLFMEYHRNPEATQQVKDAEGWFHTGDAGYVGDDGHLRIIDRVKDVGALVDGSLFAPKFIENKLKFFPYIKEAVAFGADRDNVCAFINIDLAAVGNWADRQNISYTGYADLAGRREVLALIAECVRNVNEDLAADSTMAASQVQRFLVLHKELDADDGELTRTRKVRRGFIAERYSNLVEALYSNKQSVAVQSEVRYEDGRTGTVSAELSLCDAVTYPPATCARQPDMQNMTQSANAATIQAPVRGHPIGETLIEVRDISLSFGGVKALTRISFDIREHEIRAIIGPNGAGKSSMLNCINGVYKPQEGSLHWRGEHIVDMTPTRAARMGLSRTFQNIALFKGMTVLDNIMAGCNLRTHATFLEVAFQLPRARSEEIANRETVEEIIEFLEIEHIRKTPVGRLPYGLQKRVELGRALAAQPSVLLLDEPMAGMNIEEKQDMCRFILDVNDHYGTTMVLIEHDMGVVMDISDRVVVLDYGKKIGDGPPDEVRNNQDVIDAYLGVAH